MKSFRRNCYLGAVLLVPVKPVKEPVTLAAIKADKALKDLRLLRQSRLSVSPVTKPQFERLLKASTPL